MTLIEHIDSDLKEAMKAKDEQRLSALRLVRSALKNKQIDLGHALTEEEVQAVVRTMVKQYRDALNDFVVAGRTDLADKQNAEIAILESYLPAQMPDADIETIAKTVIAAQNATAKDAGRVMGAVMKEIAGRADGNRVKDVIAKLLVA